MVLTISYPQGEGFFGKFNFLCKESDTDLKSPQDPPPQPPNPQLRFSVRRDCGPCMPCSRYVLLCNLSHPKLAYQRAAPPTSEGGKKKKKNNKIKKKKKRRERGMQQEIQRHPHPHPNTHIPFSIRPPSTFQTHTHTHTHTRCFK